MRRYIAIIAGLLLCTSLAAQKPKTVEFTAAGLPDELLEYIEGSIQDNDKRKEATRAVKTFGNAYPSMDEGMQKRVADLYNYAVKAKLKPTPELTLFTSTLTAYATSSSTFDGWISVMEAFRKKASKAKTIMEWVDFSSQLIATGQLYHSPSSEWRFDAKTPFRIAMENGKPTVIVDTPADLVYASPKQQGTIYGTTGSYDYKEAVWRGRGGRIDWSRTGLGAESCFAELGGYKASTKVPKFAADSVRFTNTHYFSTPLAGHLEDNLGASGFPKFKSYQRDFVIKDIAPDVDYSGSFMMSGAKFLTTSTKHPASLVFKSGGKPQMRVSSLKFTITTEKIVSENAAVAFYVGDDSISNSGINVRYTPADHRVVLINNPKRNFYSPFYDGYHELDIYSEVITWDMGRQTLDFSTLAAAGATSQTLFESSNCYTYRIYREIQGIDDISPIKRVYDYAGDGNPEFRATDFADYIGFDISQALLMIHALASHGLVSYNEQTGIVSVKQKLEDYMKAFGRNKDYDYDALAFESTTKGSNATMELGSNLLTVQGVEKFVVSDSQRVVVYPRGGRINVGKNRSIGFSGRIDAGRFVMFISDGSFDYEQFGFDLPHVDSLFFYVPKFGNPDTDYLVRTPLYNLAGNLQVDRPDNHSGLTKNKDYPIFNSTENSYVYYDKNDICGGRYDRQRFYYQLHPFTIKSMLDFVTDSLQFNGVLTSGGIFPDITYPLSVQRDYYLGFRTETPSDGYPAYGGKGTYRQRISLDHYGLKGTGDLDYLTSTTHSKSFLFLLDSMVANTDTFFVREDQGYPDIQGGTLSQHWLPYADSMAVSTTAKGRPMRMYRGDASFRGRLDLMAKGASAKGTGTIKEATLTSDRFVLLARAMDAEVSSFTLHSNKLGGTAFAASGVRSHVDYDQRRADLTIASGPARTELALIKHDAYADLFSWDMDHKTIDIVNSGRQEPEGMEVMDIRMRLGKRSDLPGARFVSTDPKRQGLEFHSLRSTYHYDDAELSSTGVYLVSVADAAIAPHADTIHIGRGGKMSQLTAATLVFNRDSAWHIVSGADLIVEAADKYSGRGYIDFRNDTEKTQRLYLNDISADGRGVTQASGTISDSASFTISSAFGFAGKVRYDGQHRYPWFDGGVRLLQPCIPKEQLGLLAYSGYTDPDHVHVSVPEEATDWKGRRIATSILLDKNTLRPHAAFLTAEKVADNELLSAHGVLTYLADRQQYMIGSERKVANPDAVVEPFLTLSTSDCNVEGEGPINLALRKTQATFYAYGTASTGIQSSAEDHLSTVFGFSFPIASDVAEALAAALRDDLRLQPSTGASKPEMRHAMMHHLGADKGAAAYALYSATGRLGEVPQQMQQMLLFDQVRWQFSPSVGLYYDGKVNLVSSGNKPIGLQLNLKAQISKRGNAQQMTIYLEAAKDHWYFFKYDLATQELTLYSSSGTWLDLVKAIPLEQRKIEREGLGMFRYYVGNNSREVPNWLAWFSKAVYATDENDF